eukprot:scaffold13314_cov31-Tisochrysis_lutea.AAC.1
MVRCGESGPLSDAHRVERKGRPAILLRREQQRGPGRAELQITSQHREGRTRSAHHRRAARAR